MNNPGANNMKSTAEGTMNRTSLGKRTAPMKRVMIALMTATLMSGVSQAAVISWSSKSITGTTDVSTAGNLVEAVNIGVPRNAYVDLSTTINGVTFEADPGTGVNGGNSNGDYLITDLTNYAGGDFYDPESVTGFNDLLSHVQFSLVATDTWTIGSIGNLLETGQKYEIQLFFSDTRNADTMARYVMLDGSYNSVAFGANGIVASGTFMADAPTQDFTISVFNGDNSNASAPQLQGYQLRAAVPEPSSIGLLGLGATLLCLKRRRMA